VAQEVAKKEIHVPKPVPHTYFTAYYNHGVPEGNSVYLDGHNIDCGTDNFIKKFVLEHNKEKKQHRYNYRCNSDREGFFNYRENYTNKQITAFKKVNKNTPYNEGPSNVAYLDRHKVSCKGLISQFKLNRTKDGKKYRYSYKCLEADDKHKLLYDKMKQTHKIVPTGKSMDLAGKELNCYDPNDKDKGLAWFMYKNKDGKAYYDYGCGKIIPKTAEDLKKEAAVLDKPMIVFWKPKNKGGNHHINISRIELYNNKDQKIKLTPFHYSSIAQSYKLDKCLDGKNDTFCHTAWVKGHDWRLTKFEDQYKSRRFISFTFPKGQQLKKIYIRNRKGQEKRILDMRVTIYPKITKNIDKIDGNVFNHVFKNAILDYNFFLAKPVPPKTAGCHVYSQDTCPKQGFNTQNKWHHDTWGEANKNAHITDALCKKRATDYSNWCGGQKDFVYKWNKPSNKTLVDFANKHPPIGTGPYLHRATGITYQVSSSWGGGKSNHFTPWLDSKLGWAAQHNNNKQWFNMKFKKQNVKNIIIQGRIDGAYGQYLKKFDLYYKDPANKWVLIGTKTTNTKNNVKKKIAVKKTTNEIQLNIKEWNNHITFRVGVEFGAPPTNAPPPCRGPMC